jgi:hypothetical protein
VGIIPNSERLTRKWVDFSGAEKNFKKIFFDFELDFLKKGFFVQALITLNNYKFLLYTSQRKGGLA